MVDIDQLPSAADISVDAIEQKANRPLGLDIPGVQDSPNTKNSIAAVPEERIKLFFDTRRKDIDNRSVMKADRFFPALREATRVYRSKVRA